MNTSTSGIRIGIWQCLIGAAVGFNGGHARDRYLTDLLARFVKFVPVWPDVEIGLGTPRESIRLQREADQVRLVAPASGADRSRTSPDTDWPAASGAFAELDARSRDVLLSMPCPGFRRQVRLLLM